MAQNNIVINGVRPGRVRADVLLFKETFRFLSADKEMLVKRTLSVIPEGSGTSFIQ